MKLRHAKRVSLVVAALCAPVLGVHWEWTDGGVGHGWDVCDNWDYNNPAQYRCYPTWSYDDVIIPAGTGTWAIDLISETIDDLSIEEAVDFGAAEATPTLTVDTLTIVPGGGADIEVTMNDLASIVTQ